MRPDTRRGGRLVRLCAPLTAGALLAAPSAARGQEEFRSAEPHRPIRVEDAVATKHREWELELGARGALVEGGGAGRARAEVKTGAAPNAQLGLELEAGVVHAPGGGAVGGIESAGLHLLYAFARETWSAPALAFRVEAGTPGTGGIGREEWSAGVTGLATRSFDRLRIHLNAGYVAAGDEDGGDFWRAGAGFDYPVGLFGAAVLGDVYAELPESAGRVRVWAEVGIRWQRRNDEVIDFGLGTRLDEWEAGRANVEIGVGLSRIFGVAGLSSRPPWPDPRID